MNYFVIEQKSLWIYRFGDETDAANYLHGNYEETGELSVEDVVVREDGLVCKVIEPTGEEEFVGLEETSEHIDPGEMNKLISELSDLYKVKDRALSVSSASEIGDVLNQLCERKDQRQNR